MYNSRYQMVVVLGTLLLSILIAGCVASEQITSTEEKVTDPEITSTDTNESGPSWIETKLTDVMTGERFSISDLLKEGKPVILHTFAVWCPGCSMQLRESTKLLAEHPDEYIVLGLDIDPNEDSESVKRHIEKNNFSGYYATAPSEMTKILIGSYSPNFVLEIPQTIMICPGSANRMGSGVFDDDTLIKAAENLC